MKLVPNWSAQVKEEEQLLPISKRFLAVLSVFFMFGAATASQAQETDTAIFAGGCFWCVESDFDHVDGVLETVSGYAGGTIENPTYQNHPDYIEAVKITYDPSVVTYDELLTAFWHSVDATDAGGQFCDRGHSYITTIFADGADQLQAARASKQAVAADLAVDGEIVTPIVEATTFYDAEDYHQDYYQKNPVQYNYYRFACGRNGRVDQVWGDKSYLGINH